MRQRFLNDIIHHIVSLKLGNNKFSYNFLLIPFKLPNYSLPLNTSDQTSIRSGVIHCKKKFHLHRMCYFISMSKEISKSNAPGRRCDRIERWNMTFVYISTMTFPFCKWVSLSACRLLS